MIDIKNYDYSGIKNKLLDVAHQFAPYFGIATVLMIVHYLSVFFYKDYCVVNFSSFYNVVLSVSPLCSYLLDIITICNGSLTKMWYIFGGFVIIKITEVFGRINVFSNYSKKPNEST